MSTLNRSDQVTFATGKGTVVFGEFVGLNEESLGIGSVFTSEQSADGLQTAICLFGSMANFTDYLPADRFIQRGRMGLTRRVDLIGCPVHTEIY